MGIVFTIKEDYLGDCALCMRQPAKHKVYMPFDPPIVSAQTKQPNSAGEWDYLPPVEGVWEYVCDECLPKHQARYGTQVKE